jgi:hypothetical protein
MITKDGYAAVPWGTRYVILYNGQQLDDVATADEAVAYIRNCQKNGIPPANKKPLSKTRTTNKKTKSKGRLTFDS